MMNIRNRYLIVLFVLTISMLFFSFTQVKAFPYCDEAVGRCVEDMGCRVGGCMAACEADCFESGHCALNIPLCGRWSPYLQDTNCCWWDYSGTCTRDCDCTNTCCTDSMYDCGPGCGSYATSSQGHGSLTRSCTDACGFTDEDTCYCYACTPTSCPAGTSTSGTHGTYTTYTCRNNCNDSESRTCYCDSSCTPALCPSGTSETATTVSSPLYPAGVSDYHSNPSCTNSCGEGRDRDCYCNMCTPPTCSAVGYYSTAQFYSGANQGKVPNSLTAQCRNGNSSTPNRTTLCSLTYRDCYCTTCLKACPNGLYNTAQTASPNLILENFRECTNDCGVKPLESEDDCYEAPSGQPTESLVIVTNDPAPTANGYDFLSLTHTGDAQNDARQGDLNDPLLPIKMEATYTDTNGASDVEGMFVWFRESHYGVGTLGTPVHISSSASAEAPATDSWGFMLRRDSIAGWIPYVPSYAGTGEYWTTTTLLPSIGYKTFAISGVNGQRMVEVTILEIPQESVNSVTMEFTLRFSDASGNLYGGNVSEGDYNIFLLGLDRFSFTPYDNYENGWTFASYWTPEMLNNPNTTFSPYWQANQLRYRATPTPAQTYARDWIDSTRNWVIDRTHPQITNFSFGTPQAIGNNLRIQWSVSDDRNIHSVVGNIYTTESSLARPIQLSVVSASPAGSVSLPATNPFLPRRTTDLPDNTGRIEGDWSFKVVPDSPTNSATLDIDIGENTVGLFEIYLTVFDDAGNFSSTSIDINLTDWFVTGGGLAHSQDGSIFFTKAGNFTAGIFPPYPNPNPGLLATNADYSSELWAEGAPGTPDPLEKSSATNQSYNITNFRGNGVTEGYYFTLMKAFEKNRSNLGVGLTELFPVTTTISGLVSDIPCGTSYCVLNYTGPLTVNSGFTCDKKTLIFVAEDLVINTPIYNTDITVVGDTLHPFNGCIFVVAGSVTINPGTNVSTGGVFRYDRIHGYILSDGLVTIEDERPKATAVIDGVYINGGLNSSYQPVTGTSIVVDRYLRLEERLSYPVLGIDYHPKYGVLGGLFFANDFVMQSVEVGVKP